MKNKEDLESDRIREYMRSRGYARHIIQGGLDNLVIEWERRVGWIATGRAIDREDYLNWMDGRHILHEVLSIATTEQRETVMPRITQADKVLRQHSILSEQCIWGEQKAIEQGWTSDKDWWYFTMPKMSGYWSREGNPPRM